MVKISMLLPARGRSANLRESVASLFDLAKHPDEVEVLVRLDDNDPDLHSELAVLRSWLNVTAFTGPRLGYSRMHEMYNGLAERASGNFLFAWNDDIEMVSVHWDELLTDAPLFSVQFPRRDVTATTDYTLPVIGQPIFEVLGHLSLNAYCDAWISDFSAFAGTSVIRDDIVFTHHRLNDATLHEQNDGGKEWARFKSEEQTKYRRADMEKVMAAPGWPSRFDGWNVEQVDHVGIDYINLAAGERKAGAVRLRRG